MAWPSNLPGPCSMQIVVSAASTPKRMIRAPRNFRFSRSRIDQYDLSFLFTRPEYIVWEAFKSSIGKGADWFNMDLFDGLQYTTQNIRMITVPSVSDQYPYLSVSFKAEVYSRIMISIDDLDTFFTGDITPVIPGLRFGKSTDENGDLRFGVMQR